MAYFKAQPDGRSVAIGFLHFHKRAFVPVERIRTIRHGRPERLHVLAKVVYKRQTGLFHPFDNTPRYLICPVRIEMGVVGQSFVLPRISTGRIMHESPFASFLAQSLKQDARHFLQIYQRHLLPFGHPMHGFGIVGVCGLYLPVLESPAAGRGHQNRMSATLPDFVNERFQACGEGIISSPARSFLFLVVVPELHEHVVTRFHLRQGFLQPSGTDESVGTFAALRIIGKADFRIEETGNHLSPTGPGLFVRDPPR